MTVEALTAALLALPHVTGVRRWQAPGKDRLYIDTVSFNGGAGWNGGVGYKGLFIGLIGGGMNRGDCAGGATSKALDDTMREITALAAQYAAGLGK